MGNSPEVALPFVAPAPTGDLRPQWAPTSPPEPRRRLDLLLGTPGVVAVALVVGVAASWFAWRNDLLFLYADARSHLTIARRLIDGPTSGIGQFGTVWLPLPHVLLAPFVAVRALWRSGLAAIPLDLACLAIEAAAVFSIVRRLTRSRLAAWIGVLALLTNPSILYLHTTGLTEPVLFASMLATVAMLTRWADATKPYSGGEMAVFCGLPASAMILARYDGWAFTAAATVFVIVATQIRWGIWRYSLRMARSFVILPVVAALWWMWFNWINFGDPLEFQRGRWSAQAQQELLARDGLLPDQHDLVRSLGTYTSSVVRGIGWIVIGAGVLGMLLWAVRGRWQPRALAPWLLVAVPFGFYVASLYTGQIAVRLDATETQSMFNLRYGVEMLPGLAVFAGLGAGVLRTTKRTASWSRVPIAVVGIAAVAVAAVAWWPGWRDVPVVREGLEQRAAGRSQYAAAEWMREHARDGTILIDDSINPLLPVIDADLDRAIAPFSGPRWDRALRNPSRVDWVYVDTANPFDAVGKAVRRDPSFPGDFVLRHEDGPAKVYQRRSSAS